MKDPYRQAANALDSANKPAREVASTAVSRQARQTDTDTVSMGHKYMDPQSRSDEEYMNTAQRGISKRLSEAGERMSERTRGEYTRRRTVDRRYGRRSGR